MKGLTDLRMKGLNDLRVIKLGAAKKTRNKYVDNERGTRGARTTPV
jgi:hypothetical protein